MSFLTTVLFTLTIPSQDPSRVFQLDRAVEGGEIALGKGYSKIRSEIPDAVEFIRSLGDQEWEAIRVRVHSHDPMQTSDFSAKDLAQLARLEGDVEANLVLKKWQGETIKAWEVQYAEGGDDPIGMFAIIAYVQEPTRWVQVLVTAPSNYEDVVRTEIDGVLSGLSVERGWGPKGPVGLVIVFWILNGLGSILILIGWIMGIVAMFRDGQAVWGVISLIFCCSLATLIYTIINRDRLSGAMWLHIIGILLSFLAGGILFVGALFIAA